MPDTPRPAAALPADLQALQTRLGHTFAQPLLLTRALTHKSFGADHYERLEFLGDAVLSLCVSALLYARFDRSDEGDLTRVRAHLVRQDTLHRLALQLGLPELLRLSEGESRGGGAQRPSILADTLEALFGAVYLDAGFERAREVVDRLFAPLINASTLDVWTKDAKTALQEWLQGRKLPVPTYRIDATRGKAHEQVFVVACEVPDLGVSAQGEGTSRRSAEQAAATQALADLMALPPERTRGARPVVVVRKARAPRGGAE
ncbi:ribonuclease III [Aquabacterium fontiphilum]|jgi:ribonuclease-3|uniref:ribonuclease III n=1 Tax=Aquabacterium fontiphilum TaxID=450365 RepID=UPI00191C40A9|nr:ribonuclease III [Aquabacterium fontiphilum]